MTLLILYAVLSIFFSFLCSILEAALLSFTPTFIKVKRQEGKGYATTLANYKKDIDRPLIAILTLNTIAHTVGAILVGVQAEKLPYKVEVWGINLVGIVSAIMTFLILISQIQLILFLTSLMNINKTPLAPWQQCIVINGTIRIS